MVTIILFLTLIGQIFAKFTLRWNMDQPYIYNGFIYSDSYVVVMNPAIQIKITNNEEICNFYINTTESIDGKSLPFRVVVKSAYLGLGELDLKPNASLEVWRNKEISFSIVAEACHDPDSWSAPATVHIKVLDPPGPLWGQTRYSVSVSASTPIGTSILQVTAFLPKWSDSDNKICQYLISAPRKAPFQIDGKGTITVAESLLGSEVQYWALIVTAEDCSQPVHRHSQVNVFVSLGPQCKFGWTGFYTNVNYRPGSGVKYLSKSPKFHTCDSSGSAEGRQIVDDTITKCIANKTLRLTTSVELRSPSTMSTDAELSDHSNCKLDYHSLRLQREVCGISQSYSVDLLNELNKQKTGALLFPIQANIFPVTSLVFQSTFSFYFWLKRDELVDAQEEYIICQIDEVGNDVFSVSLKESTLRIQVKSYHDRNHPGYEGKGIPTSWKFKLPQLIDKKWRHVAILASRSTENTYVVELSVFIDGEMADYRHDNPIIDYSATMQSISSNMTDVFLGQCPKSENTEFKGLLAGVTITPGVVIKTSTPRCLTKCYERLYFNGMNKMNPGMSVSLNSEMQMIIVNGHSITEVTRLVKVIGFVNPTWDPVPGTRHLLLETDLSCGARTFPVSPIKILLTIDKHRSKVAVEDTVTLIRLFSTVTSILSPDSVESNPETGAGVSVFANTTLDVSGIPQSTNARTDDVATTISRCTVTLEPRLRPLEYMTWPRRLIEAVSGSKYSIKVRNNSRTIVFQGRHNPQIYEFLIQHLRYFSPSTTEASNQGTRLFKLQCFSNTGSRAVKSNVAVVRVTIWYNNRDNSDTDPLPQSGGGVRKAMASNITIARHYPPLHAQSNAALMPEVDAASRRSGRIVYNILLGMGLIMLMSVLVMFVRKTRGTRSSGGCTIPYRLIRGFCVPLQMIKERIFPGPSVRVELSRDFRGSGTAAKRRDIGLEMQWDDAELKVNNGYNIIGNPIYEASIGDIDDIAINRDVPPNCEEEENSSDNDTYEDFTDLYYDRNRESCKGKIK